MRCSFAHQGTYGHECGAPAVKVGVMPSCLVKGGLYYARRCEPCSKIEGGENKGVMRWEPFDAQKHANHWP